MLVLASTTETIFLANHLRKIKSSTDTVINLNQFESSRKELFYRGFEKFHTL